MDERELTEQDLEVPVIDLGGLDAPGDAATARRVVAEIGAACRNWGFFQVIGHGIADPVVARMQTAMRQFFALPRAAKRAVLRTRDNPRGYYDRELTKNTRDQKEVFDFGFRPDPGRADDDPVNHTVDGHNQWPVGVADFRAAMDAYFDACARLGLRLSEAICLSLRLPAATLHPMLVPAHTSFVRLNLYPREDPLVSGGDHAELPLGDMGVHHHTDAGILTILLQDEVPGLQVRRGGRWYGVPPLRGALVINLADMLQMLSNDIYRAPLHRVLASTGRDRYSVPFFYNPAYDADCGPLQALVTPARAARYRPVNWGEFRKRRADGDFADYGHEVQISDYRTTC